MSQKFELISDFNMTGDQPSAVNTLASGINEGVMHQTLLGVTGSGKTFTMANIVQAVQKPTLVIACLLYTSQIPRDKRQDRMTYSA